MSVEWPLRPTSTSKVGSKAISPLHAKNVMEKILTCECSSKTMVNNAVFVSGPLPSSSGKAIVAFTKEHVCAILAVRIRICVRCAH